MSVISTTLAILRGWFLSLYNILSVSFQGNVLCKEGNGCYTSTILLPLTGVA
jgi:hypothetical protein